MPALRDMKDQISSSYLLSHADNPVDWYPWGPDALGRAKIEDKPLFISIGYAACHWCHVMAHESFEDTSTAALINRAFIPIKIDREERPDLDQLYMTATQAATGRGGWPMTVFATPDGRPFFAGTYFPPNDRGGQPGFPRVLLSLEVAWNNQRQLVEEQADTLRDAVHEEATFFDALGAQPTDGVPDYHATLDQLVEELSQRFDREDGGFGGAPKFPRPSYVDACLVHYLKTDDSNSLAMATKTLEAMAAGGIYDHLAGGFARYSVDRHWLVPHFEKMLSDQALLVTSYLHAYQITKNPSYAQVVQETIDWVLQDLRLDGGGFASSVDADAGGGEGSHAVFTPHDIYEALEGIEGTLPADEACAFYGVTADGTFEHGASVLARARTKSLVRTSGEEATRAALLRYRRRRVQPDIDDKVLLEWNAMLASSLAQAGAVFSNERWAAAARELVVVLDTTLCSPTGRLGRSSRNGVVNHLAMLGDYAWLVDAMTRLYELDGDGAWLEMATRRAVEMLDLFWDGARPTTHHPNQGAGFFTTGSDAEALLVRSKDVFDGALPSSTSIAVTSLERLALLTGNEDFAAAAERTLRLVTPVLSDHPTAVPDLVASLGWLVDSIEIALPGPQEANVELVRSLAIPFGILAKGTDRRCSLLSERTEGLVYVCRHGVCGLPAKNPEQLVEQVNIAVRA